jgi:hypothetical protein
MATIPLGRPLPSASCDRPGRRCEDTPGAMRTELVRRNWRPPPLLGLAPGGVFRAATVAGGAVRSYRTISPLPPIRSDRSGLGGVFSVALSLGSPPPGVTRHRISVEPGLSSPRAKLGAAARPSGAFDMDKGGVIVKALCEAPRDRLREGLGARRHPNRGGEFFLDVAGKQRIDELCGVAGNRIDRCRAGHTG